MEVLPIFKAAIHVFFPFISIHHVGIFFLWLNVPNFFSSWELSIPHMTQLFFPSQYFVHFYLDHFQISGLKIAAVKVSLLRLKIEETT